LAPKITRAPPPQRGSEQRGQKLDRLSLLSSGERLDPHRAEPDLTVIDCLGAQRRNRAAAVERVRIFHWLSTRQQRSRTSTAHPPERRRLGECDDSLYIDKAIFGPRNSQPAAKTYEIFTAAHRESAVCQRPVSPVSAKVGR
jgi:hypothetical protein